MRTESEILKEIRKVEAARKAAEKKSERCDCQDSMKKKKQAYRRHLADLLNGKKPICCTDIIQCRKGKCK